MPLRPAVSATNGVSCRSAFHSRRTPFDVLRRAQQHLDHIAGRQVLAQVAIDFVGAGLDVFQHLFQQRIVMVRQRLHQLAQRLLLVVLHLRRNLHQLRRLALAVAIGALADHIDIAVHRLAIDDRHLPQHQRRLRIGLQRGQRIAHAAFQRVDLVDEQHMRHAKIGQQLQRRRHGERARRHRLAYHDSDIDHRQRGAHLMAELDRARAVQHRPGVAQVAAMADADLGGHRAVARIGGSFHRRAGRFQHGLEQRGLAAAVGTHQRHRAGTSAVLVS